MKKIELLNHISAFVVGFLFAIGLAVSGMTQSHKVVGFLDLFGDWDPSLIFVMLGAILVHFVVYRLIRKRNSPLFSAQWHVPTKNEITKPLLLGGFLFGVGWGLGGFCPGPAVASLAAGQIDTMVFLISMLVGMKLFSALDSKLKLKR